MFHTSQHTFHGVTKQTTPHHHHHTHQSCSIIVRKALVTPPQRHPDASQEFQVYYLALLAPSFWSLMVTQALLEGMRWSCAWFCLAFIPHVCECLNHDCSAHQSLSRPTQTLTCLLSPRRLLISAYTLLSQARVIRHALSRCGFFTTPDSEATSASSLICIFDYFITRPTEAAQRQHPWPPLERYLWFLVASLGGLQKHCRPFCLSSRRLQLHSWPSTWKTQTQEGQFSGQQAAWGTIKTVDVPCPKLHSKCTALGTKRKPYEIKQLNNLPKENKEDLKNKYGLHDTYTASTVGPIMLIFTEKNSVSLSFLPSLLLSFSRCLLIFSPIFFRLCNQSSLPSSSLFQLLLSYSIVFFYLLSSWSHSQDPWKCSCGSHE